VKYSLIYLGMKKIKDEAIDKIIKMDENVSAFASFAGRDQFLFVNPTGGEAIKFMLDPPAPSDIKRKALLIIKARPETKEPGFPGGIEKEVVFMELNRPILENLYNTCFEVFLPVLGNPMNQIGWSDLVSKDLMDKFHQFLAHTYVTIGQIKGRTLLPLPPSDVTSSERTSSKDKAHILETSIIHW
jgi:dynein heavy chain